MWTAFFRISLVLFAALIGVGLLLYGDRTSKEYFSKNLKTRNRLQTLQTSFYALEGEILRNGSYLYYSYDRINQLLEKIEKLIQTLQKSPDIDTAYHRQTLAELKTLRKHVNQYVEKIQSYLTVNASLKNSAIYIPTLQLRAFKVFNTQRPKDRKILLLLARINASIFLARNAQDIDFLSDIKSYVLSLDNLIRELHEGAQRRLLETLRSHLQQFIGGFPLYIRLFDSLMHNGLIEETDTIFHTYQRESTKELNVINRTTRLLLSLYLFSLAIVIYFILRTYRENRKLRRLKNELEQALVTDALTRLGNRLAYHRAQKAMKHPVLLLFNIDHFKHINEFYGTSIGDAVLVEVGRKLNTLTPESIHASLFRMGGDDFGVLFEQGNCHMELISLVRSYHEQLNTLSVTVEGLDIDISLAIGASDKSDWLFETADMALKHAKNSQRKRYAVYTPELDNREEIAKNIRILRRIREAIDQRKLIPYFQPICARESGSIVKFEALARIELDGGRHILQPYSFIHTASEAKLSGEITLNILRETLRIARDYPYGFSVNLGAEDIANTEDRERIISLLEENRELCPRLTFEILESEEIRDYDLAAEFIRTIKHFGCSIAIDDFGSGYSNFEKILLLDIDLLKVDGSLIRRIDRDRHSELVVQTILDFARHAGWKTVAEYVHSKAIFDKVSAMGFDYIQGYYIGKPSRDLKPHLARYTPPNTYSSSDTESK